MQAAITITAESVYIGASTEATSGYGIYGAKAGELAQLLNETYTGTVQWNGANLNQLKNAEYIKVGDSQNPNVLKDEDLAALGELSGAKFLDIDGSVLDEGADITKIKAGSSIKAVTLPNNLTKEQVNGAGASLVECNPNFGSCLSLDAEMEEREISIYPYKFDGQDYEYTGDVSALTDNGNGTYTYNVTSYERDLTLVDGYPLYTYTNDLAYSTQYTVSGDKVSNGKAVLSEFAVVFRNWDNKYENPFTHELVDVNPNDSRIFEKNGNKFIMVDFSPNTREFTIDTNEGKTIYKYEYVNLDGETEYTDRKEAAKALEDAVLAIKYADTPVKVGSFQGFDLSVTVNSNMMGGGMSACLQGAASHTTKLIESFAHNLNRLEAALYNIDGRIERTQDNLAKLRLDHAEAQKIVAEPFPQQEELDTKEQRLKVVTDELNQAAIEAKKNAPKREKTCYFERAKMKRDAARLAKKPRTPKDKAKGRGKQGIE